GGATDGFLQPHGHFRRAGALPIDDTVKLLTGDAEPLGGFGYGHAHRLKIGLHQKAGMAGILHWHFCSPPSVVIHKVDIERTAVFKSKDNSPVGAHRYRIKAFELALERMKPEGRAVQLGDGDGSVKRGENFANTIGHLRWHFSSVVMPIKSSKPAMAEAFDHKSM